MTDDPGPIVGIFSRKGAQDGDLDLRLDLPVHCLLCSLRGLGEIMCEDKSLTSRSLSGFEDVTFLSRNQKR